MRYTPYSSVLKSKGFTEGRIRKVTLNGGFTCPNLDGSKARGGCTYCDNRSFSPSAGNRSVDIGEQLRRGIEWQRAHLGATRFIAYFQTFSGTYASVERLEALYRRALAHPDVIGLAIGTRPDCLSPRIVDLLAEIGRETFLTLEIGLQSAHDASLDRINRAHGFHEFAEAMDLCRDRGFDLCIHLILGLPGESREHFRSTALALSPWRYHSIKIHPLHIVKGTALEAEYRRGEYRPLTSQEYVEGLVDVLERVPDGVGIQRFTADARGDMLVAPEWCRNKGAIRNAMEAELLRRDSRQGAALPKSRAAPEGNRLAETYR